MLSIIRRDPYPYDDVARLLDGGKVSESLMAFLRIKHFKGK